MTDFDRLQTSQGLMFKEAVLTLAETKSRAIIAEAGQKRADMLEEAYKQTEHTDYATVKRQYLKDNEHAYMSVATEARRELLKERGALVQDMFDEVEQKLVAFTKSTSYAAFLTSLLQTGASDMGHDVPQGAAGRITGFLNDLLTRVSKQEADKKPTLTVRLRPEDRRFVLALQDILPSAQFIDDKSIRIGGLKVDDGHVMFDETLDKRFADAKERFFESGRMCVNSGQGA